MAPYTIQITHAPVRVAARHVWVCFFVLLKIVNRSNMMSTALSKVVYTRDDLLALSRTSYGVRHPIPAELRKLVYIPARAAAAVACDVIHETAARIQTQHPSAFIAIMGILTTLLSLPIWLGLFSMWTVPRGKIRHWWGRSSGECVKGKLQAQMECVRDSWKTVQPS